MPLWLVQISIVLIVLLIGVALYGLFHLAAWLFFRFYKGSCPKCGKRGLRIIVCVTAATDMDGKRIPAWWKQYFQCDNCGGVILWRGDKWQNVQMDDRSG